MNLQSSKIVQYLLYAMTILCIRIRLILAVLHYNLICIYSNMYYRQKIATKKKCVHTRPISADYLLSDEREGLITLTVISQIEEI